MTHYRIVKGNETDQVDGVTGKPADPYGFYFEPTDYDGDVLWSARYDSLIDAVEAAEAS